MDNKKLSPLDQLYLKEGWELETKDDQRIVHAYGKTFQHGLHPVAIHNKIYRNETNPDTRFFAMKRVHDIYWPQYVKTWNYWEEERFYAHCENYSYISMAGGASTGKSVSAAKILIQAYFSDPKNNAVIVASTTLKALSKRVFGYVVSLLHEVQVPLQFIYTKSPTPEIKYNEKDEIHSISALAAGVGSDPSQIKNYIGRHPRKKFLLMLDEATDLSPVVLDAVSNLEAGKDGKLQVWVIGNSLSKSDLHGALSTPKAGWNSISWEKDIKWKTTQPNGICLYFSPYRSPAIHETDPEKRALLENFFITAQQIEDRKKKYGENSLNFWRMVLGFWLDSNDGTAAFTSQPFLEMFKVKRKSLWSGLHPLRTVGGLDPAFSQGGDSCILRLAILGQSSSGDIVLDYRDETLLFRLKMYARHKDPIDIQIADQIIQILIENKCALEDVTFDCTGQGRTFPELVRLRAAQKGLHWRSPIKVYSSRSSGNKNNQDVIVKTPTELWDNLKDFIQTNQICGLDDDCIYQLCSRLLVFNPKTKKRELENKLDFRNRMGAINPGKGASPDEADAAALCLFSAIHAHGFYKQQARALEEKKDFFSEKYDLMRKAEIVEERKVTLEQMGMPKATYTSNKVRAAPDISTFLAWNKK